MNFKALCMIGVFAVFGVNANNYHAMPLHGHVPFVHVHADDDGNHTDIELIEVPPQNVAFNANQVNANQVMIPGLIDAPQQNEMFNGIAPIVPPVANNIQADNNQMGFQPQQQGEMANDIAPIVPPVANNIHADNNQMGFQAQQQDEMANDIAPIVPPIANNIPADNNQIAAQLAQLQHSIDQINANAQLMQQAFEIAGIEMPTANTNHQLH